MASNVFPIEVPRLLLAGARGLRERGARASRVPATPERHHPRHLPKVRHHLAEGPHLCHPQPLSSRHRRRRPPVAHQPPSCTRGEPRVPSPPPPPRRGARGAALPEAPLHAPPARAAALGRLSARLPCRVPVPGAQGRASATWHYMNKVYPDEFLTEFGRAFELFCEGVSVYRPVWDHYLGYWKQSVAEPGRVLFLTYGEMMVDTADHVRMLAELISVPFTSEEESGGIVQEIVKLCSFKNLKELPVNSSGATDPIGGLAIQNSVYFRTAKVGDWENYMTTEMAEKLDHVIEEKVGGCGLTF
ncbi:unnamed protein product [Miscanthus lutarioriparius]|uniref:Sulfotransferase n=1 Tax=Miscanthus lutarioriparius TaxID=422564 RepID=A0A811PF22_9POAL|nr:unnamed protein product [Miscanthus lutarioriparius]